MRDLKSSKCKQWFHFWKKLSKVLFWIKGFLKMLLSSSRFCESLISFTGTLPRTVFKNIFHTSVTRWVLLVSCWNHFAEIKVQIYIYSKCCTPIYSYLLLVKIVRYFRKTLAINWALLKYLKWTTRIHIKKELLISLCRRFFCNLRKRLAQYPSHDNNDS